VKLLVLFLTQVLLCVYRPLTFLYALALWIDYSLDSKKSDDAEDKPGVTTTTAKTDEAKKTVKGEGAKKEQKRPTAEVLFKYAVLLFRIFLQIYRHLKKYH